jgi:hypothetical protein
MINFRYIPRPHESTFGRLDRLVPWFPWPVSLVVGTSKTLLKKIRTPFHHRFNRKQNFKSSDNKNFLNTKNKAKFLLMQKSPPSEKKNYDVCLDNDEHFLIYLIPNSFIFISSLALPIIFLKLLCL